MFDLEKAITSWRRNYEYRQVFLEEDLDELTAHLRDQTDVFASPFLITSGVILGTVLLTIVSQVLQAARAHPVEALRRE